MATFILSQSAWEFANPVRACVCVCVCVCACVFILFHLLVSSGCTTSVICVRSSDRRSFVVSTSGCFCQVPSSLSLNLSYFASKDENSSRSLTGEKMIWYNAFRKKMIYIDIGYKSATVKPTSYEKILKIRRLLWSEFFNFESSP